MKYLLGGIIVSLYIMNAARRADSGASYRFSGRRDIKIKMSYGNKIGKNASYNK
jgi:hypothetical protein